MGTKQTLKVWDGMTWSDMSLLLWSADKLIIQESKQNTG